MNEKYYIPEVEDLRVGFVYQYSLLGEENTWEWKCLDIEDFTKIPEYKEDCQVLSVAWLIEKTYRNYSGNAGRIRVPYLTKEQIEKEGWEYITTFDQGFKKDNYFLLWKENTKYLSIIPKDLSIAENEGLPMPPPIYFQGYCKSINEFRTIMKLLNIK